MERGNASFVVHLHSPGDHRGSTEPGIGISNERSGVAQARDHAGVLDKVRQGRNGEIGLAKLRSGRRGTARDHKTVSRSLPSSECAGTHLWYKTSKPASRAQRALIPSHTPGATTISGRASNWRRRVLALVDNGSPAVWRRWAGMVYSPEAEYEDWMGCITILREELG